MLREVACRQTGLPVKKIGNIGKLSEPGFIGFKDFRMRETKEVIRTSI